MDGAFEQQVRKRAYEIWIAHGKVDGRAHDHWIAAERDLKATTAPTKPRAARSKTKTAETNAAPAKASAKTRPKVSKTKN